MTEIWVANASPIIVLAKIDRLGLLLAENRRLLIPEAVAFEILRSPSNDAARQALEAGWGSNPLKVIADPSVTEWGLGLGETEILSLAKNKDAVAVVNDRAARIACKSLGIRFIGTLGVVLRSRCESRISSSPEILRLLQKEGMRLDDSVIQAAMIKITGEKWLD